MGSYSTTLLEVNTLKETIKFSGKTFIEKSGTANGQLLKLASNANSSFVLRITGQNCLGATSCGFIKEFIINNTGSLAVIGEVFNTEVGNATEGSGLEVSVIEDTNIEIKMNSLITPNFNLTIEVTGSYSVL